MPTTFFSWLRTCHTATPCTLVAPTVLLDTIRFPVPANVPVDATKQVQRPCVPLRLASRLPTTISSPLDLLAVGGCLVVSVHVSRYRACKRSVRSDSSIVP